MISRPFVSSYRSVMKSPPGRRAGGLIKEGKQRSTASDVGIESGRRGWPTIEM
jgi:hypothetical protein